MHEISDSEFAEKTAQGVVFIDFSAEWCGPCKVMLPVLDRVSKDYTGKIEFYTVDIDKSPATAARNGVMSVPTMMVFKGGQVVDRMVGAVNERKLRERLDSFVGAA